MNQTPAPVAGMSPKAIRRELRKHAGPRIECQSLGRRRPKRGYNRPAFLITTDTESPVEKLIQAYFDRWQIEVLHREMKSEVGVGQTQVRNELANERTHSVQAAAFAALNLAAYRAYGGQWNRAMPKRPSWRKRPPMRLSARELLNCFRNDLVRSGFFATKSKKDAIQGESWVLPDRETYAAA